MPALTSEEFWAQHPEYAARMGALRSAEATRREEAFAGQPHTVCGLLLRGITAYDLLILHGIGNPFLAGGERTAGSIAQFFAYLVVEPPRGWWGRRRFFRRVSRLRYADTCAEIESYVDRFFADGPKGGDGAPGRPAGTCFLAPLVVAIACETGWTEEAILSMRLDRLFQYQKELERRRQGREFKDYSESDGVLSEFLADYNLYLAAHAAGA